MYFRQANIGLAVAFAAIGAALVFVVPDYGFEGFSLRTLGWVVFIWGLISLTVETLANGLASAQRDWSMNLRDANTIPPCGLGALGTAIVLFAEPLGSSLEVISASQFTTLGWIVGLAGIVWLIFECAVNGVVAPRRRRREGHGPDDRNGPGPVILS